MPQRIWHKLSRLVNFPRQVLIELAAIRQTQARLEGRLDNFFRISLQNQDASAASIASLKRQFEHLAGSVEVILQEIKEKHLDPMHVGNRIKHDREQLLPNAHNHDLSVEESKSVADDLKNSRS